MKHTSIIRTVNRSLPFVAITTLFLALQVGSVNAQETSTSAVSQEESSDRCFIGSSAFMLMNLSKTDSPHYYQLDVGYELNDKEAIIVHAATWRYHAPLGIPYGSSYGAASEDYPGSVRSSGIGIGYRRFVTEQFFASVHATAFRQTYMDTANNEIQKGTQLFMQYKVGYHMDFFDNQFYLEPAITATHWPVNTNLPASFAAQDKKWNNYFLFEPNLNFGMSF